jgi:hypothetical protein
VERDGRAEASQPDEGINLSTPKQLIQRGLLIDHVCGASRSSISFTKLRQTKQASR